METFQLQLQDLTLLMMPYNTPPGTNFDPNIAGVGVGNGRGFDYLNGPSAKKIWCKCKTYILIIIKTER